MLTGKQLFIWKINEIEGGDPVAIALKAKTAGYAGVNVKIIDGKATMNGDKIALLIQECKARGIKVSLWGYFYGVSPNNAQAEANAAAALINKYYLDGIDTFLIDVEEEYKASGSKTWATAFMSTLKGAISPLINLGLCSYRFPSVHPEIPWAEFLQYCNFHAPQVYWEQSSNPAEQLQQSYNELIALKNIPFFPAGAAYCHAGWCATPAQAVAFADKAMSMGLKGITYWAWHSATGIAGMWEALAGIVYVPKPPVIPPPDPVSPELLKAHILSTSTPHVNLRKQQNTSATILTTMPPNKNIWVTRIYAYKNNAQWIGVIVPNGGDGALDYSGFAAMIWNDKPLIGWGWV